MDPPLGLYLLGPPRIERDGVPVRLDRRKAIALVAYLAVTGQSHRRDSLVNLLWPDYDSSRGRAALRRTLYTLRNALGSDWLAVDREQIGLQPAADPATRTEQALWVDVVQFQQQLAACETHGHPISEVCPICVDPLTDAVKLARGGFMSGFGLKDSVNFDDWQLFQAELLRRELNTALQRLVRWHSAQREFEPAVGYARRRLALDPLDEQAHRHLMRLYAWSGRRSAALRQFQECVAILDDQLGVPPQEATSELFQDLQEGRTVPPPEERPAQETLLRSEPCAEPPSFLEEEVPAERPLFVARERELAQLDRYLQSALDGQGKVVFVTGEAGAGKTAIIQEFARRAQDSHPDLVIAAGHSNAHTGVGDPYLPFREILGLLTGDVEAQWAAGAMTQEQARRLWDLVPLAVQALVKTGPDLINTFVPGMGLLERAASVKPWPIEPGWPTQLETLVARGADAPGMPGLQQSALFEQYTQVLRALAGEKSLLLALDDLQWADGGSVNLLFHLGRRIAGCHILILGAYRPAEVALGRPASLLTGETAQLDVAGLPSPARERHPLASIVNEFKRTFGDIEVDLERTEGRPFVDALLDSETNLLDDAFREALHQRTQGHPLFTTELLRGMQERGDLTQDGEGRWVAGPALDWDTLPARVEAVVAERIDRLPQSLRDLLNVASVEGETFTAEVTARAQAADERETARRLSETLDRQHRLVSAQGIRRLGGQRLSRYRFRHILYQKYLYSTLDPVEQVYLHEQVGTVLEGLYGDQEIAAVAAIAPQLARHFEEAGIAEKAIHYLHQAGERAVQLSAYQEGLAHLTKGLDLLKTLPDSGGGGRQWTPEHRLEHQQQELRLQLGLGMAWMGIKGYGPEAKKAYTQAHELCQQMGETSQLCRVLGDLSLYYYVRAEHQRARGLGEQALSLAQRVKDPLYAALGHWYLGVALFSLGEFTTARAHLERVIAFYNPREHHRSLVFLRGSDAGLSALSYDACCLWCLGFPEQALKRSQEALVLARELGHPFSLADALCYGGCVLNEMRRDAQALKDNAEELMQLSSEKVPGWSGTGTYFRGEALTKLGQVHLGMVQMREGMADRQSIGVQCHSSVTLCYLGEAQAKAGQPGEGLATLAEALVMVEETDERHWEAEIYHLQAELLLMQGDNTEAEASLHRAIEVARRQRAKSWELRATTNLARLWQRQGKTDEARQILAEIYGWFTEGFDTPDLKEAKTLLDELS